MSRNEPEPESLTTHPSDDPEDEVNSLIDRIDAVLAEVEEQMESIVGPRSGAAKSD